MLVHVADQSPYSHRFLIHLAIKYGRKKLDIDLLFGFNTYELLSEDSPALFAV